MRLRESDYVLLISRACKEQRLPASGRNLASWAACFLAASIEALLARPSAEHSLKALAVFLGTTQGFNAFHPTEERNEQKRRLEESKKINWDGWIMEKKV